MNKDNVFRSSDFFMAEGDVLHMLIRDESGEVITYELYGDTSDDIPENGIVYDENGVVNVDVLGNNFLQIPQCPNLHGTLYYNGYIYASPRNPYGVDTVARIAKIRDLNYTDITLIDIRYASLTDTQPIYYMEQLQRIGNYIYTSAFAVVGGTSTNILVQLDTRNDTYKIFKITDAYGSVSGKPVLADDTFLYYVVSASSGDPDYFITTTIIKYTASDFESETWTQFNTSAYGATGVPIVPVSTTEYLADNYFGVHSLEQDDTYLYVSFLYSWIPSIAGKLLKIIKATMVVDSSADIPNTSDDMAQSDTHLFLGTETTIGDYGSTWAVVAVRKSDMNVTELLPHSTEGVNSMSYGVKILNIEGIDYLFDLRLNKIINILNISNVDSWTDGAPSDPYTERIISFVYSDSGTHYVPNEILVDDYGIIHITTWATIPELIKFALRPL